MKCGIFLLRSLTITSMLTHFCIGQGIGLQNTFPIDRDRSVAKVAQSSFDLQQLQSPRNSQEFLTLLNTISENALLLRHQFQDEAFLLKLFGPGLISDPLTYVSRTKGLHFKKITPLDNSLFRNSFKSNAIILSFIDRTDLDARTRSASLSFYTSSEEILLLWNA